MPHAAQTIASESGDSDAEVILALRIAGAGAARDIEAEAALYRQLAPRVRRYGLRHLRDASAADDLMQQVMLLALDQLRTGRVREPERVVSFVFGSCRTLVLAMQRKESRRESLLARHGEVLALADISIAPRHDHERVARCLDSLRERERSVLLMSFYDEKPAEVVAGELGLTAGNVRVIRHRGIAQLRHCVEGGREASA
ncbi:RNA polymerase sigma-70 factor, ECF subfamily [Variovorax sp. HW608]|uniref:RNA polymerase sigma factor n=1 Tax=Variovorax sp. HW608 TaxID=1034889 RepID=UPI00081FEA6C|nr:sigma-70 family RNA polymerase sigma factor [Variovorax sp. HW608]SCK16445.1 RNA polymerase sigma-70 factor, ECF subfamily [Variovorax sp. HW608]